MSFSFGFYNSINEDRLYDALDISEIFDGIIRDGVYASIGDYFLVRASPYENMVTVGTGRAWFNHTWNKNDAALDLPLKPASDLLNRIDTVVIDVDRRTASRTNSITVVYGVESHTPAPSKLINETNHWQYPLCEITRRKGVKIIDQDDIINKVGTEACPFVLGALESIDVEKFLSQWEAAWPKFLKECEENLKTWNQHFFDQASKYMNEMNRQMQEFESFANGLKDQTTKYADDIYVKSVELKKWIKDFRTNQEQNWEDWQRKWKAWYDFFTSSNTKTFSEWREDFEKEAEEWLESLKGFVSDDQNGNLPETLSELSERLDDLEKFAKEVHTGHNLLYKITDNQTVYRHDFIKDSEDGLVKDYIDRPIDRIDPVLEKLETTEPILDNNGQLIEGRVVFTFV